MGVIAMFNSSERPQTDRIIVARNYELCDWLKEHGIEWASDYDKSEIWIEIFNDDITVFQFKITTTVEQFKWSVCRLHKKWGKIPAKEFPGEFWFATNGKKNFDKFYAKYANLFE